MNYLSETEKRALQSFLKKIGRRFEHEYLYSVLFGSKAEGHGHAESDIDVAVILRNASYSNKCEIFDYATEEMIETDVHISPLVFSGDDFELQRAEHSPLLREIERHNMVML